MGTVSCPELIWSLCLAVIRLASLKTYYFSRLNQPSSLQDAKNGALQDMPAFAVNKLQGQLTRGESWECPRLSQYRLLFLRPKLIPRYRHAGFEPATL
jgi:hypothetical protein